MLSLTGALNMASQAMQTQMTGIDVSGQNLANVNTQGYSRQTVDIQTSPDIATNIGMEGTGSTAVAIQQAVNSLLNSQIVTQQSSNGYWTAQQSALQSAQTSLNEFLNGTGSTSSSSSSTTTSDTGLSGQLTGLFNAFQAVATSPTSIADRQSLISQAQTLASTFNQVDSQLSATRTSLNTSLTNNVTSANSLLSGIAQLNGQIATAEFSGGTPNDLLDERQQDLQNLSQLTSIQTSAQANGAVDVSIGGQTLVTGDQVADTLQTYDASGNGSGQLLVQTATGGVDLTLTGGSMQGTIDARDGELAGMQNQINSLASGLITGINSNGQGGYNSGYSLTGTTGADFFTGTDASNIAVDSSLVNDPSLLQASASPTATGDGSVALQIANLASSTQASLNNETFGNYYDATVAGLGDALQTANTQVTNQTAVSNMLSTQQSSVSGVNIDQEMTNLMGFQRAYEASAQLVTTINEMMQTVNNMKTG
jgi:flagellar hook-associated protein 1 FlgK